MDETAIAKGIAGVRLESEAATESLAEETDAAGCWRRRHFVAGVEATYLKPQVDDAPLSFSNGAGLATSSAIATFDDLEAAPRIWLGLENEEGRGIRARYWFLDAHDSAYDLFFAGGIFPVAYSASTELEVYTIDLEYTHRRCFGNWHVLGSFGVRHGAMDRTDVLTAFDSATTLTSQILSDRQLHGTGITSGIEATRPVGERGLHLFLGLRSSTLWGTDKALGTNLMTTPGGIFLQVVAVEDETELYILEVQSGLLWSREIESLDSSVFARLVFEFQYWDAEEGSFDFNQAVLPASAGGSSRDLQADLLGLSFAMGLTW